VAGLRELTVLEVADNQLISLAGVDTLPNLRTLRVPNNRLNDLRPIAGLPKLRTLDIRGNPGISSVTPLSTLPLLGSFFAGGDGVSLDLAPLAGRQVLSRIVYRGATLRGGLAFVANLPSLTQVDFNQTPLTDAHVAQLAAATSLDRLDLDDTGISDLEPLGALTGGQNLSAVGNQIRSITFLANWPVVTSVNLADNPVESLEGVETLEELNLLDVSSSVVSDLAPLVANGAFGGSKNDEVILTGTPLGPAACPDIRVIEERLGVVTVDFECP
jgi:Leucine-rich repeat (LRR) protein